MRKKYELKIGKPVDVTTRHQHRIEYFTLGFGALCVILVVAIIALGIHIDSRGETWLSAILAFGLAAASLGIAGALSVEFTQYGLVTKGTLGFGIFILVFVVSTVMNCRC
ncbi:MAG: hypothetical protein HYX37_10390 [Rhizobiales bacterium]|nr:hypothetical protein [Hyphomicrobiales bacterium]